MVFLTEKHVFSTGTRRVFTKRKKACNSVLSSCIWLIVIMGLFATEKFIFEVIISDTHTHKPRDF